MSRVSTAPDVSAPASSAGSRVNRPALAVAMAVGQAIGVLPACFIIGGPRIALIAIGIVVVLTVLTVSFRRSRTMSMSTAQPRPRHFVMTAASAAFHGGVTGYVWLALYLLLAGGAWLLRAIVGWPDVPDVFAAVARPSMYAAVPFFAGSLTLTLREVIEQLYPDRAGVLPVFETAHISQRLIWVFTGIVLGLGAFLLAAAALNYQMSWMLATVLMIVLLSASAPLATLSSTEKRPVVREVIDATRRALEGAGYQVLQAPRTGDASVDPLLADLSLYVRAPGRGSAFAIDIKASSTGRPLDWSAASSLQLKVSALSNIETRDEDGEAVASITPVLVALTPADDTLREFARDHRMMLFELSPSAETTPPEPASTSSTEAFLHGSVLSNAALRNAAQQVPELIRAFVAERAPGGSAAS
jgi:hypothetical protein